MHLFHIKLAQIDKKLEKKNKNFQFLLFCIQFVYNFRCVSWVRGFKTFKDEATGYAVRLFEGKVAVFRFKITSERLQMTQKLGNLVFVRFYCNF